MSKTRLCAAAALLLAALPSLSLTSSAMSKQPAAPDKFTLADIAWMTGPHYGEGFGGQVEEHWAAPAGGTMFGGFRLVADGKTRVLEYLVIEETDEGVIYRFKHFNPDYTTWEENEPLVFTLIEASPRKAVFHSEAAGQDAPRRLEYALQDDGALAVTVHGSDPASGELDDSFTLVFRSPD